MFRLNGAAMLKINAASVGAVICHGNSLTVGTGAPAGQDYVTQLNGMAPLAGSGLAAANKGVGGQSINIPSAPGGDMMTSGPSNVDALLVAGKTNVLIAWEGTNQLVNGGANAATAAAAMQAYVAARLAAASTAGKKLRVLLLTMPPGYSVAQGAASNDANALLWNQAADAYNNALRANYKAWGAHGLADIPLLIPGMKALLDKVRAGNAVTLGDFGSSGLYAADNLHLVAATYTLIAQAVANALRRMPR